MKKFFIFLSFMLLGIFLFALEMEVTKFEYMSNGKENQTGKIIYDEDGNPCSVLKVETDLKSDLVLSKPTVHKKIDRGGGVYYFFIRFRERYITFGAKGYSPYTWKTPRMLTAGKTYLIKLNAKDEVLGNIPVVIQSEPKDAEKFINEKSYGTGETFKFGKGKYTLALKKKGYRTYEKIINVSENNFLFKDLIMEKLVPQTFHIESSPSGALVLLNGKNFGTTPCEAKILPGIYNLKFSKNAYFSKEEKINIKENDKNIFYYKLDPKLGNLQFNVFPENANATLKKSSEIIKTWQGSKFVDNILEGYYQLAVEKKGYITYFENIKIYENQVTKINCELEEKRDGKLDFSVSPSTASVQLKQNGKIIDSWTGDKNIGKILEGKYSLIVSNNNYVNKNLSVIINRNKTSKIKCKLKKISGNLFFTISPDYAKINLSQKGKKIESWEGNKNLYNLSLGKYLLTAEANGYKTYKKNFSVGKNKKEKFDLKMKKPFDKYFFTFSCDIGGHGLFSTPKEDNKSETETNLVGTTDYNIGSFWKISKNRYLGIEYSRSFCSLSSNKYNVNTFKFSNLFKMDEYTFIKIGTHIAHAKCEITKTYANTYTVNCDIIGFGLGLFFINTDAQHLGMFFGFEIGGEIYSFSNLDELDKLKNETGEDMSGNKGGTMVTFNLGFTLQ